MPDDIRLLFSGSDESAEATRFSEGLFTQKRALEDRTYKLYVSGAAPDNADSISYTISVVPDLYPNVPTEIFHGPEIALFRRRSSDSYIHLSLSFNYRTKSAKGSTEERTL